MTVYIGYICSHHYFEEVKRVAKVFGSEDSAIEWRDGTCASNGTYHKYEEMAVE